MPNNIYNKTNSTYETPQIQPMKHLKSYEHSIKDEPQIGDSVICTDIGNENDLNEFLSQNIRTMV